MADGMLALLPGCALPQLEADSAEEVLTLLAGAAVAAGHGHPSLVAAVVERERNYPTGLPTPIPSAIPHTDPVHVVHSGLGVATLAEPVEFGQMATAGVVVPVRFVVMLFVTEPAEQVGALQQVLARLADADGVQRLLDHPGGESFAAAVADWLEG